MLTARQRIDFAEVKGAALADIRGVLGRFLPGGKVVRGEYVVLNPRRVDRHPGSFCINLRTGRWADFAVDAKGGDLISLVAYLKDISQLEAAKGPIARRAQRLVRARSRPRSQKGHGPRSTAICALVVQRSAAAFDDFQRQAAGQDRRLS
jgi:hypothetical protein